MICNPEVLSKSVAGSERELQSETEQMNDKNEN
jgi:hypothetical protein